MLITQSMIETQDYYKLTHKTAGNSRDFELFEQDFTAFLLIPIQTGTCRGVSYTKKSSVKRLGFSCVVPVGTIKVITLYFSLSSACLSYQGELLTIYRQIGDNSQRIQPIQIIQTRVPRRFILMDRHGDFLPYIYYRENTFFTRWTVDCE